MDQYYTSITFAVNCHCRGQSLLFVSIINSDGNDDHGDDGVKDYDLSDNGMTMISMMISMMMMTTTNTLSYIT